MFWFYQLLRFIRDGSHFGRPLRPCARESWPPPSMDQVHGDLCDLYADHLCTAALHLDPSRCLHLSLEILIPRGAFTQIWSPELVYSLSSLLGPRRKKQLCFAGWLRGTVQHGTGRFQSAVLKREARRRSRSEGAPTWTAEQLLLVCVVSQGPRTEPQSQTDSKG